MTGTVAQIWRHPVKSHGAERLGAVELSAGQTLPGDRLWAVAHEAAKPEALGGDWAPCVNFSRGAKAPALMAISARYDAAAGTVALDHPDLEPVTLNPDTEGDRLVAWARPLMPETRAQSARVVRIGPRGMTDSAWPSVALLNLASLRALGQKLGQTLDPRRFRGNIWLEGLAPWEEWEWLGRRLRIGGAELLVRERITRCRATMSNPDTGRIDADTLGALEEGWGHRDFGLYAEVTGPGRLAEGDRAELLP